LLILFASFSAIPCVALAATSQPVIVEIKVHDSIQPVSQEYILAGLSLAARNHADAVILDFGTPGGILESARAIVQAIERSPVPIIVYVDPEGRDVDSLGLLILEAADFSAMAPGTNLNAGYPTGEGKHLNTEMQRRLDEQITEALRTIPLRHGNDQALASVLRNDSGPIPNHIALQQHMIDVVATDKNDLLSALDGRTVHRADGTTATLHTANGLITLYRPTRRERLLRPLMNPNLAILLLTVGALLIYLEINTPGTIIPGALGTFIFLLACFALHLLPLHPLSVFLLFVALLFLILEAHLSTYGFLAAIGIGTLIYALTTLVTGPIPEMRVELATAIGTGLGFGGVTAGLLIFGVQARRAKVKTGAEAMVGWLAVAQTDINPDGQVLVRGELWQARLAAGQKPVSTGDRVKICGVDGLTLEIVPLNLDDAGLRWHSEAVD